MLDLHALGWPEGSIGELDHRLLRAPSVKLRAAKRDREAGDVVYSIDLRLRKPNAGACMTSAELHSIEHFLLEGFQRLLPESFVSVGVMGCRTGFYLILFNEGRAAIVCDTLESILHGIGHASEVPYARIEQCGDYRNHDLAAAQAVAREVLAARVHWMQAT